MISRGPVLPIKRSARDNLGPGHGDYEATGRRESSSVCDRHLERITAHTRKRRRRVLGPVRPVRTKRHTRWS